MESDLVNDSSKLKGHENRGKNAEGCQNGNKWDTKTRK